MRLRVCERSRVRLFCFMWVDVVAKASVESARRRSDAAGQGRVFLLCFCVFVLKGGPDSRQRKEMFPLCVCVVGET